MFRLITFGGLLLQQDGILHLGPAAQRWRLAMLAVIAAARGRGVSRERLVGLLWPESNLEAGKHSLYQAVHAIRRALGSDEVLLGSTALQLNPDLITSDVGEFELATEQGAYERAVRLYRGSFLEGFRLDQAPEFEQWQDGERVRHSREYASALEALAGAARNRGQHTDAVRWWRRLAAAEPVSTRAALGLIEALVANGDRASALQFATVHASLVRQHLEAEPDPAIATWVARLQTGDVAPAGMASSHLSDVNPARPEDAAELEARALDELKRALSSLYRIGRKIDERALLLSFTAHDNQDNRPVELHVLGPRAASLSNADRVQAALERVAALHDPRIVPLRGSGTTQGIVYFATAPVEGLSLRERLVRERALPLRDAVAIAEDLSAALAHAHGRGVRHGDLRPKHVLLTRAGIRVAGFGIVEALDLATAGSGASTTAITIGAPAYLSPEQLAGEVNADERSDLYSLGAILFEMLAGEPPFSGVNLATMLSRKLSQPAPSIRQFRESVPPDLESLVARCLARSPADRFLNAQELAEGLQVSLAGQRA
ncbi:MAG: protein kinase [Geminicoccaceae bacterium]|nr:protein kinase [Geminicoccaceae bacterium]